MSQKWIGESEQLLKMIEKLQGKADRDRLEVINTMLFTLSALDRSAKGWRRWIQNLGFMARFSVDELIEMEQELVKCIQPFIQYDIEVTKKHEAKMPQIRFRDRRRRTRPESTGMIA
ncbi:MAG: DUF2153 family protein [Candidatus Bathyarchaeota archaeon]|nr:MAG: DUF2153 family protein [Candidatus Bathyarchaeota archaeon]